MNSKIKKFERPSWHDHWLGIAKVVAKRSTCLRRRFGAVVVKNNVLLASGYNGAPRNTPNCTDLGRCYRKERNIPSGSHYEKCRSVHAEANTIINSAREGISIKDTVMYLYGENFDDNSVIEAKPCKMCRRMIINVGITKVITSYNNKIITYEAQSWIDETNKDPFKELDEEGY
ncbi:MAG: dCMP deaminase family protein [Spirochaetes bacterium]|nr:dCMP deaminase family protein [Spirochaetota bacterium]